MPRFLWVLVSAAIVIAAFALWSAIEAATADFQRPTEEAMQHARAAVVFTGDDSRIDVGLRLLASHAIDRLFISGVNPGAGLTPDGFVAEFSRRNPDIVDLAQLSDCCIAFGVRANNTLQNALETRCWLRRMQAAEPLLLITSKGHMARARLALAAALPGRKILPYPSDRDDVSPGTNGRTAELMKFFGTYALLNAPWLAKGLQLEGAFANGCPDEIGH